MLGSDQKWTAGNFEEALEAFAGIVNLNIKVQGSYFAEAIDKMLAILKALMKTKCQQLEEQF